MMATNHLRMVYLSLILVGIVQCCIWFVVKNDPFFGDAIASTSQAANHIYQNNFATIFYPIEADPGHPTLYSYLLAMIWTVFGKSLVVAHAYSCVWAFLFSCAVINLAKHFLHSWYLVIAIFFTLIFATYLSQSAMMLNTVAVMTFFIWAITAIYNSNPIQFVIAASLMCATHLQATFLLLSLFSFDAYRNIFVLKQYSIIQWIKTHGVLFGIPFLVFCIWLYLHYKHTGWLIVSPHYSDADELNGAKEYIKAMLTIAWRLVDYGMITCYLILGYTFFKTPSLRSMLMQGFLLLAPCCIAMAVFLSNTIGHRYFFAFNVLAILASVYIIQLHKPKIQQVLLFTIFLSLLAGNILYYPGKTLGDATLAYRSYFSLAQQIEEEFPQTQFYSHAPIANPPSLTELTKGFDKYKRIHDTPLDSLPAIIQSNINAEFTADERRYLLENWHGKSYESGAVYVNVFLNPRFYPNVSIKGFRQPSRFEIWMMGMKQKLK